MLYGLLTPPLRQRRQQQQRQPRFPCGSRARLLSRSELQAHPQLLAYGDSYAVVVQPPPSPWGYYVLQLHDGTITAALRSAFRPAAILDAEGADVEVPS